MSGAGPTSSGPGLTSIKTVMATIVTADSQATGRQRGDGRWPSG